MKYRAIWLPLGCYLGVTVMIPLLKGGGASARTHLLTVALTALVLTLLCVLFVQVLRLRRR